MDQIPESVTRRIKQFEGNERLARLYPELSYVEMATIHAYSDNQFDNLNRYLRGENYGPIHNKALQKIAGILQGALLKCSRKYIGPVYRGTNLPVTFIEEHYEAFENNTPVFYKDFLSSSKTAGKEFRDRNTKYVITSKTGIYIAPLSVYGVDEEEVLLKKDTYYMVTSIYEERGITFIRMYEI